MQFQEIPNYQGQSASGFLPPKPLQSQAQTHTYQNMTHQEEHQGISASIQPFQVILNDEVA